MWMIVMLLLADVAVGETRFVVATIGNLRDQPDTGARIVGKLPIATAVNVVEERGQWTRVVVAEGEQKEKSGWVAGEFLVKERPTMESLRIAYDAAPRSGAGSYFERVKWADRSRALDWEIAESLRRNSVTKDSSAQLIPFADFNSIKPGGLYKAGPEIVFLTAGGLKIVDPKTLRWRYIANSNTPFSPGQLSGPLWEGLPLVDVAIPGWYKQPTYLSIVSADTATNPQWLLTSNANEGAVCDGQDILDLKGRRRYSLPCEGFNSLLVDGRTAWLGSGYGVTRIDLDTAERSDFVTTPPVGGIAGVVTQGHKIYYGTFHGGAFVIDRNDGTTRPIKRINTEIRGGLRLEDLLIRGNKVFFLLSPIDKTGWYTHRTTKLAILDVDTLEVDVLDTGISIGTKLVGTQDVLYGYGAKEEWIEGGQRIGFYGGAFEYSIPNRKLRKLVEKPVTFFSTKSKRGLLVDAGMGGGSDIYHMLAGKYVDYTALAITEYKEISPDAPYSEEKIENMVFEVGGKFMKTMSAGRTANRHPAPKFEFVELEAGDPRISAVQLIKEMREFENARKDDRGRRIMETFTGLQVRPSTVSVRVGQIADWRPESTAD